MSRLGDSARDMTVTVTFFADLRRFLPRGATGPQRYRLTSGATVADLLDAIGIEPETDLTAAVDSELAARDTPLHDGAEVMLLSPMEGGATPPPTLITGGERLGNGLQPSCGTARISAVWGPRKTARQLPGIW
jgi:molybdopterin converting factor small subunit